MTRWRKPQCKSGKGAFRNQGAALRALDRIARDEAQAVAPTGQAPQRAYECRSCGAWHLTSKGPGVSAGPERKPVREKAA